MKWLTLVWVPLGLALAGAPAPAGDLAKLERRIGKEPAYRTKAPRYCLLVFGPEAKTRVWLVQDGDTLYVDRNGNGDLTDEGEKVTPKNKGQEYRLFEAGDLRDGTLTHKGLIVTQMRATADSVGNAREFERIKRAGAEPWVWTVRVAAERPPGDTRKLPRRIKYVVNGDGQGWLVFAKKPEDAPVIHFNGPWTMDLQDVKQRLTAGHESMLQVGIGTRGVGPGTFTWVEYPNTIPADAYPEAVVTFPPRKSGEKPLTRKYTLKERC
jgi:hypothetical protein